MALFNLKNNKMKNILLTNSIISMKREGFNLYAWLKQAHEQRKDLSFIEFVRLIAYANLPARLTFPNPINL